MLEVSDSNSSMPFPFDSTKAIQAVAFLLKTRPSQTDNYMRLLKILYIADRESLQETGAPITGDNFVSMEHGTMLSKLLNLVKQDKPHVLNKHDQDYENWDKCIVRHEDNDIRLVNDPGVKFLCDYEVRKLNEVAKRYEACTQWDMKKITHGLPEYDDPGKSSKTIPIKHLLQVLGLSDAADAIIDEAIESAEITALLGKAQ